MTNVIKIKKGLDIRLKGRAQDVITQIPVDGIYSIVPDDFYGFKPKLVVKDGDCVSAGDALFVNKDNMELKVVSPVSGKIIDIIRGKRRKLLSIRIKADEKQTYKKFAPKDVSILSAEEVKQLLLDSGLFSFIHQRPYDIVANPNSNPKGIFISAFNSMPLAQDFTIALRGSEDYFQKGIETLSRIAPVTLCFTESQHNSFNTLSNTNKYIISGPNPSGNVGVQINHISPINKGEVVWTLLPENVIFIGKLVTDGIVDLTRTIAVAGSEVIRPGYVKVKTGTSLEKILTNNIDQNRPLRIINGNPLVGKASDLNGFLSSTSTEITVIPEGSDKNEVLGWIMPRFHDFSTNRSYFSWLQNRNKTYTLDARIKGGERHIIMSGEYDRVFPMNIYAGFLIKAILTGDLDKMEALGIYEVAPEDFAVAEFVDSSKLELQRIVREGLDMLRKELE